MRKGWTYRKLGDICSSELGKTLNQSKDIGQLKPYLCSINVQWDHIDLSTVKQARFEDTDDERYSVTAGDLLVCEGGDIGRAAIWSSSESMLYQNALHRIRFNDSYLPRFYLHYLHFLKTNGTLDAQYGKGVTIKHLVKSSLMSIPVPVPPLAEQERIVAELDLLQGIIDKQKAQLKELDTLAQSIFHDMFGDPKLNDKDWKTELFKDTFRLKSGDGLPEKEFIEGNIPVFGGNGISGYHSSFNKEGKHIIVGRVGAYCGNVRFVQGQFWLTDNAFDAFFSLDTLDYWFACYLLNSIDLHKFANHAAQPVISNVGLKDIQIILPPLTLQQAFATKIEAIERQKASINASIDETQKLFDFTMDKYFG